MIRSKWKLVLVSLVLILLLAVPAIASSSSYYVNLPNFNLHINLVAGTKSSTNQNASNKVSNVGGDYTNFVAWVDNKTTGNKVTQAVNCFERTTTNLAYSPNPAVGNSLMARGRNAKWSTVQVSCSGTFDFK